MKDGYQFHPAFEVQSGLGHSSDQTSVPVMPDIELKNCVKTAMSQGISYMGKSKMCTNVIIRKECGALRGLENLEQCAWLA